MSDGQAEAMGLAIWNALAVLGALLAAAVFVTIVVLARKRAGRN